MRVPCSVKRPNGAAVASQCGRLPGLRRLAMDAQRRRPMNAQHAGVNNPVNAVLLHQCQSGAINASRASLRRVPTQARHNTSLRKTLSRSEWNRGRGSARPPLNMLQGTDSIRRRTSHEGELAETAVPASTSKMHRRSSGPSLTDGSVARSAQPVLRPPPTPVTSPCRCSSTTQVRPAAVLTVLFGRCSSSPQPGQVDRLNAENFVVANVAAAVLTSITKRGSRHYCW
jgi:hypothetical protein